MPAADAMIRVRIDQETKTEAAAILEAVGLTLSDAVRLMLRKTAQDKELPFCPFCPITPNAETVAAMEAARRGEFDYSADTVEELMAALTADDDEGDDEDDQMAQALQERRQA